MARRIESVFLKGPAGRLEALLEEPEAAAPRMAVVVCHPHPGGGGTMHNKVVYRMARGLRRAGAVVLRFNYRGVNLSEGTYDEGVGEREDARTAAAWLADRYPHAPFWMAGFSFGSRIALSLGCEGVGAKKLIAVGFPTSYRDSAALGRCDIPRVFIQSTNDEYGPRAAMEEYFESLNGVKRLFWVEAGDHFFAGALDAFEERIFAVGGGEI